MGTRPGADVPFKGFPDFRSNVTFTPIQFFTLVIPHASRSTIRIVAFVLRQLLGWVDRDGNVMSSELRCSYQDFIEKAGVSRDGIAEAVQEAIDSRYIVPVETPAASEAGKPGRSGVYSLRWDMTGPLTHKPQEFQGFYYPPAALDPGPPGSTHPPRARIARMNVPNVFFDHVIPNERLSVIRVVGALLFYSIEWGPGGGTETVGHQDRDRTLSLGAPGSIEDPRSADGGPRHGLHRPGPSGPLHPGTGAPQHRVHLSHSLVSGRPDDAFRAANQGRCRRCLSPSIRKRQPPEIPFARPCKAEMGPVGNRGFVPSQKRGI